MDFTFEDALAVVREVAAIQMDNAVSLHGRSTPEVEAYWRGRQEMAAATVMVLEEPRMIERYVAKAKERAGKSETWNG